MLTDLCFCVFLISKFGTQANSLLITPNPVHFQRVNFLNVLNKNFVSSKLNSRNSLKYEMLWTACAKNSALQF